jgi:5,10-methylenetetrahydromethanopterin reductase
MECHHYNLRPKKESTVRYGVSVATDIRNTDLATFTEELGFDTFWGTDSQMIWSDVYSYLALAATKTSRITIGPLVAVAPTRLAPVTAQSIATINSLAPGRTVLAIGTALTAMQTMGMKRMRAGEFGEYLRVVRALLHDEEVDFTLGDVTAPIQFMHRSLELIGLDPVIPVYVSAMGPVTQRLAGRYGDGIILNANTPDVTANLAAGAERAGRALPSDFAVMQLGNPVVLMPGEAIDSDFVIEAAGPIILSQLHMAWEALQSNPDFVPRPSLLPAWEQYLAIVNSRSRPARSRYIDIHEGHGTYVPADERPLLTKQLIQDNALVGQPDAIAEHLRQIEGSGTTDYVLRIGLTNTREQLERFMRYVKPELG